MIDRKLKNYEIMCDKCGNIRLVVYSQYRNIVNGKCKKRCISCRDKFIPKTAFKKGCLTWNKGLKGFLKGHPAYNNGQNFKGKTHTEESKLKMRKAKLGIKRIPPSKETIEKIRLSNIGKKRLYCKEKHWNWKGGITTNNRLDRQIFRSSIQKQVFERDNYTCQLCQIRGVSLQVDHIQPWAEYTEGRFDINNCRTLCQKCHYQITFGREMPEGITTWGHNFNIGGNSI